MLNVYYRRSERRKREVNKERVNERERGALMTYNTCRTQYRDMYIFLYIH